MKTTLTNWMAGLALGAAGLVLTLTVAQGATTTMQPDMPPPPPYGPPPFRSQGATQNITHIVTGASAQRVPVIFIPGYAASVPDARGVLPFVLHRGVPPQALHLSLSYDLLVHSLMKAGYREGRSFFGAVYDWRMAAAPNDGTYDGTLSLVTAPKITHGRYAYAIDYLGFWLDQAVQANPGLKYVDVVTHSTGGILARAYIQSPAYGAEYKDARGITRKLPKIRYLILGACPNEGTDHSWRPWKGDFQDVLSGFIPTTEIEGRFAALAFAYVSAGGTIHGPDHDITKDDIMGVTVTSGTAPNATTFFRQYVPMRQSLMPTYDFLAINNGTALTNVNDDPALRSDVLLDLNGASTEGNNPWAATVGTTSGTGGVIATYATGAREKTSFDDFLIAGLVNKNSFIATITSITELGPGEGVYLPLLYLLTQLNPATIPVTDSEFPRTGDEENTETLAGDGNAPFVSYLSTFKGDAHITLAQWGNGDVPSEVTGDVVWTHFTDYPVYHDVFFYNPGVRKFVIDTLTGTSSKLDSTLLPQERRALQDYLNGVEALLPKSAWPTAK